jgi:tetratricopeptide (TPR) repeat protein
LIYCGTRALRTFDQVTNEAAEKIKKRVEYFAKLDSILRQDDTDRERSVDEPPAEFEGGEDRAPASYPAVAASPNSATADQFPPSYDVGTRRGRLARNVPAPLASPAVPPPAGPALLGSAEGRFHGPDPVHLRMARSRFRYALRLEKEGKVRLALRYYQKVLDLYPDTPAADAARDHLESIGESRARKAQQLLARARSLARLASPEEAGDDLETILRNYPDTPQAKIAERYLSKLRSSLNELLR